MCANVAISLGQPRDGRREPKTRDSWKLTFEAKRMRNLRKVPCLWGCVVVSILVLILVRISTRTIRYGRFGGISVLRESRYVAHLRNADMDLMAFQAKIHSAS